MDEGFGFRVRKGWHDFKNMVRNATNIRTHLHRAQQRLNKNPETQTLRNDNDYFCC